VDVMENTSTQREQLKAGLLSSGFELLWMIKSMLIEKLKCNYSDGSHSDEVIK
jgi:hypothetical protein